MPQQLEERVQPSKWWYSSFPCWGPKQEAFKRLPACTYEHLNATHDTNGPPLSLNATQCQRPKTTPMGELTHGEWWMLWGLTCGIGIWVFILGFGFLGFGIRVRIRVRASSIMPFSALILVLRSKCKSSVWDAIKCYFGCGVWQMAAADSRCRCRCGDVDDVRFRSDGDGRLRMRIENHHTELVLLSQRTPTRRFHFSLEVQRREAVIFRYKKK